MLRIIYLKALSNLVIAICKDDVDATSLVFRSLSLVFFVFVFVFLSFHCSVSMCKPQIKKFECMLAELLAKHFVGTSSSVWLV
jgi:hypothetical protein